MSIAVIIATHNRPDLLSTRALKSIANQTRSPDYLIICDDSDTIFQQDNIQAVQALDLPNCSIIYTKNNRTSGASGCWNSAIDKLLELSDTPDTTIAAFLDDDDSWHPTYLEYCEHNLYQNKLDMVATGIRRIENPPEKIININAPSAINISDLLVTNTGIQGSNLFLRLSIFLKAGGFDENLSSSTDRDLCIRLSGLNNFNYRPLYKILVNHYAEENRSRLSTKGSFAKLNGLDQFWYKYSGQMTNEQKMAFTQRATELFSWSIPDLPTHLIQSHHPDLKRVKYDTLHNTEQSEKSEYSEFKKNLASPVPKTAFHYKIQAAPKNKPFKMVIAVITSEPQVLLPLLKSLKPLITHESLSDLTVMILDNYCYTPDLKQITFCTRNMGITTSVISPEQYQLDADSGLFGGDIGLRQVQQKMSIATARTVIQRYLGFELNNSPGSIGWLLDDDMRIDQRAMHYISWLPEFRHHQVDVLLGAYEGSSPNPPLNGLRVQLMDLVHNLTWLENLPANSILPDRFRENNIIRDKYPDYYYDLSRKHSGHLETPIWLEPAYPHETVAEARSRLLAGSVGILNGQPLTRAIIAPSPHNPLKTARSSVNRGGCTFILNPDSLQQTPNTIPQIQGRDARRSDMIWAVVNQYYRGMNIKAVDFPIQHEGRIHEEIGIKTEKVQGEIVGSALYAGLTDFLNTNPQHQLDFSNSDIDCITSSTVKHMKNRLKLLKISFYRITGLNSSLKKMAYTCELDTLIYHLDHQFNLKAYQKILSNTQSLSNEDVTTFLKNLRQSADQYANAIKNIQSTKKQ